MKFSKGVFGKKKPNYAKDARGKKSEATGTQDQPIEFDEYRPSSFFPYASSVMPPTSFAVYPTTMSLEFSRRMMEAQAAREAEQMTMEREILWRAEQKFREYIERQREGELLRFPPVSNTPKEYMTEMEMKRNMAERDAEYRRENYREEEPKTSEEEVERGPDGRPKRKVDLE